jgi:protein SCO1/2
MKIAKVIIFLLLTILLNNKVFAQPDASQSDVGLDEKLGEYAPLDLTFKDENGKTVILKQLINKPTIVVLVYYRCPGVCPLTLGGVAEVLDKLSLEPGKQYSVLTISFDETDTPDLSLRKKKNYLHAIQKPFPEDAWTFLTGDNDNITKFTNAVGFKFKKDGDFFKHPVALIVLSADGKIIRYLYGSTFLPFDVQMALIEASEGRVGATVGKVLQYCFSYDPKGRKYTLNITKVTGTVILFLVIVFFIYLIITSRSRNKKAG